MRRSLLVGLALSLAPLAAVASTPDEGAVTVGDAPGGDNHWQEARGVIDAPPDVVRRWMMDYRRWPQMFSDTDRVEILGQDGDQTTMRFHSRAFDRTILIHIGPTADGLAFTGEDGPIRTEGRVILTATPDGHTDVRIRNFAHVGGVLGAIVPGGMVRDKQRKKLRMDLADLMRKAHHEAMEPPHDGSRVPVSGK